MPERAPQLDEIRGLLAHLPGPDLDAGSAAAMRERQLTKPAGALGRLEELAVWLATWQGRHPPALRHPRTVVFAGNHGVAARGVSAYPAEVTAQMVQNFIAGGAAVNQLCRSDRRRSAGLRDEPRYPDRRHRDGAGDERGGMRPRDRLRNDGRRARDRRTCGRRDGDRQHDRRGGAVPRRCSAARRRTGPAPGPGSSAPRSIAKREAVAAAVARHRPEAGDPFDVLRRLGGLEFAAMAGAILAARMGRVPVVLDGFSAGAAAAVLYAADPRALDHCVAGHVSAEPGHRRLLGAARHAPAARSRHAARRGLRRDACADAAEGRRRLPRRHGHLRRGRGQRPGVTRRPYRSARVAGSRRLPDSRAATVTEGA